jgi:hypothetical protein
MVFATNPIFGVEFTVEDPVSGWRCTPHVCESCASAWLNLLGFSHATKGSVWCLWDEAPVLRIFFLKRRSHSITLTRAQGTLKDRIGLGEGKDGRVGDCTTSHTIAAACSLVQPEESAKLPVPRREDDVEIIGGDEAVDTFAAYFAGEQVV